MLQLSPNNLLLCFFPSRLCRYLSSVIPIVIPWLDNSFRMSSYTSHSTENSILPVLSLFKNSHREETEVKYAHLKMEFLLPIISRQGLQLVVPRSTDCEMKFSHVVMIQALKLQILLCFVQYKQACYIYNQT